MLARSNFSFEKRRKELEKKKKKEAKREVRAERKAEGKPGTVPVVRVDEWGNVVEVEGETGTDDADGTEAEQTDEAEDADRE